MSEIESGPEAPLWRHRPTGRVYQVVSTPLTEHFDEAAGEYQWVPGVLYQSTDGAGDRFVRTRERFLERFVAVPVEGTP